MKLKPVIIILILSISLSVFGFIVDDDVPNPDLAINLGEFVMMTFLIFSIIVITYVGLIFSFKKVKTLFS